MIATESSNLAAVGYNPFAAVLTITFHGNRVYQYFGLPPGIYLGLVRAESHGQYFHRHIRNSYRCRRLR
ncbi:MAG: KTSC domain-containing protein [Verrucomicrobia bacterium]|nr:KTSC domain-containing protein [Verrucomicrobiota bacterium]